MKAIFLATAVMTITALSCNSKIVPDQSWGNQRWVVTELRGIPVQLSSTRKDAYLSFTPAEKRFGGNAGCNRISGNYTLEKKNGIQLGEVISTKMSCDDIAFETSFLSALKSANQYQVQGNTLVLKHNGEILLKFLSRSEN